MKLFVFSVLSILFSCSFKSSNSTQLKNCSNFKTGTFKYVDEKYKEHTIMRNDSIQIEYNSKDDIKIITSIKWINECKYILTYKDIENYPEKDKIIGKKIEVSITNINGNKYLCHIVSDATNAEIEFLKINGINP